MDRTLKCDVFIYLMASVVSYARLSVVLLASHRVLLYCLDFRKLSLVHYKAFHSVPLGLSTACFVQSGLAMGNLLSPFLANIIIIFLEKQVIKAFFYMFKTWHRSIFAVIPNRRIQDALTLLKNIQDNSIRFTLETEIDVQLPFMDLRIISKSNKVTFGI